MKFVRDFQNLTYSTIIALRSQYWNDRILGKRKPTTSFIASIDSHLYRERYLGVTQETDYQNVCLSYLKMDWESVIYLPYAPYIIQSKRCMNAHRGELPDKNTSLSDLNMHLKNIFWGDMLQREYMYGLYIRHSAAQISKLFRTPIPTKQVQAMIKQHEKLRAKWGLPIIKKRRARTIRPTAVKVCDMEVQIHTTKIPGASYYAYRQNAVVQNERKDWKLLSGSRFLDFNNFYRVLGD